MPCPRATLCRTTLRLLALPLLLLSVACTQQADGAAPAAKKSAGRNAHLVEIATVQRSTLSQQRTFTGSLRARRVVRIHALEEGRITALPFYEGDAIDAGETIVELDRELLRTELAKASAVRREAEANRQRLRRLASRQMLAKDELLRAETAVDVSKAEESLLRTRVGYTRVEAPFAGIITERLAEPGDILRRHDHVLTLADPRSLVADLQVSELVMPFLRLGDAAQIRIDALGDRAFEGRIVRIHPNLDPLTRQGRVEVTFTQAPPGVRAGQFARVSFQVRAMDRKLLPFAAVRRDTEGEYVFRVQSEPGARTTDDSKVKGDAAAGARRVADLVRIRAGQRLADRVEILEGLDVGDAIITKGFLGLKSGKAVKVVRVRNTATAATSDTATDQVTDQAAPTTARSQP